MGKPTDKKLKIILLNKKILNMTKKPSSLTENVLTSTNEQLSGSSQKNHDNLNYSINDFDDIESPFKLVKHEELGCAILLGSRRLCRWMSEAECYNLVRNRDWSLITELICNIFSKFDEIKNFQENN